MRKIYWLLIALLLFVAITFVAYYNVLKIGVTLRSHHEYVEYGFYIISAILYIALIVDPLISILFKPKYSVADIASGDELSYKFCKRLFKNLLKYGELKEEDRESLIEIYRDKKVRRQKLNKKLYLVYNNAVKKNIDLYIADAAKNTFYITAMAQSGFIDMLTVLVNNFRMVKKIVKLCGFRPSFLRVLKLYVNIFVSALVADGAQDINLTTLLGTSVTSGLKMVVNSIANGTLNAFFMLRTGFLTKHYIYAGDVEDDKRRELRHTAMAEAAAVLPTIVTSVISDPLKGLAKLFTKGNAKDEKEDGDEDLIIDLNQKWRRKK